MEILELNKDQLTELAIRKNHIERNKEFSKFTSFYDHGCLGYENQRSCVCNKGHKIRYQLYKNNTMSNDKRKQLFIYSFNDNVNNDFDNIEIGLNICNNIPLLK